MSTKRPLALERVVERLDALTSFTSESLAEALDTPVDFQDVVDLIQFDRHNYRRNLVLRTPTYELRLLCWLPGQRTSLHGHDGSACAFRIMGGTSTEIRLGGPDRTWKAGDVIAERGTHFVHQVTNLGSDPLVSLHAYSPPLPVDQPPATYEGRHIVLIGGGVSAAALAIHMLSAGGGDLKITIVERRQSLGRGPAYGTTDPAFRLNVPAERMSLFPSRPHDFVEWARRRGEIVGAGALLPRPLFGEYIEDSLAETITRSQGKVWFYRTAAMAATKEGVLLADGHFLKADAVVLATGNQLPAAPDSIPPEVLRSDRVIGDPWSDDAFGRVDKDEALLIVGTGLTTVDVLAALRNRGHRGPMLAISRRGLLPRAHLHPGDQRARAITIDPSTLPRTALGLSRHLRREAARLEREGVAWQSLIDALRPHTASIWDGLPLVEKQRFMRKLRTYWEVVRHRAGADALAMVEALEQTGRLEIACATIAAVSPDRDGLDVELSLRGGERSRKRVQRIVLCTGPQTDVRKWHGLLFRNLLRDGAIKADPLGLGLVTDEAGRAVDASGRPSSWLYTLGGLRRARLWETTAVPDLVRQAETLAGHLLSQ